MDIPRALIQLGRANCAAIDNEFAVMIHAAPLIIISGAAIHKLGARTTPIADALKMT